MTGDHRHPKIPMDQVVANELEILGSHGIQAFKYPEVFDLISKGRLDLKAFINRKITLREAAEALPLMSNFDHVGVSLIDSF